MFLLMTPMKNHVSFLLGIAAFFALSSCATTRYVSKNDIGAIHDVAIISPFAYISFLNGEGKLQYDDSLSKECARLISEALMHSPIPTGKSIPVDLDSDDPVWKDAIASLRDVKPKEAGLTPIPRELDELLEENGQKYGVVVFANGYTRDKKDYRKKVALGIGMAVLTTVATGGMATSYSLPVKNSMHTWIAIIDSENDRFVFLDSLLEQDTDPTKPAHVTDHISHLLNNIRR